MAFTTLIKYSGMATMKPDLSFLCTMDKINNGLYLKWLLGYA